MNRRAQMETFDLLARELGNVSGDKGPDWLGEVAHKAFQRMHHFNNVLLALGVRRLFNTGDGAQHAVTIVTHMQAVINAVRAGDLQRAQQELRELDALYAEIEREKR